MAERPTQLRLGPVVGHTDHRSTRIWIRTHGDPTTCGLRIEGRGLFPFVATGSPDLGTAVAVVDGLRPSRRYRYHVVSRGRVLTGSRGSVRTMPDPASPSEITVVALSCSDQREEGAWRRLQEFVEANEPHLLLMMGDQVYMDQSADPADVWARHRTSDRRERLPAMAEKYQASWSRDFMRDLLANTPTYMVWDDHDIRDGWGSWAADSPTLAERHHLGRPMFARHNAYFEDAREAYWHFQACRNPPPMLNLLAHDASTDVPAVAEPPPAGLRQAMPFTIRCGRVGFVVLDSRGDRDLWRQDRPVLGAAQWEFLADVLDRLDPEIDAVVIVTPVPIVTQSPDGQTQKFLGRRTDDVELFKAGDEAGMVALMAASDVSDDPIETGAHIAVGVAGTLLSSQAADFGYSVNLGGVRLADIDDVRDQWSNVYSRPEQAELLKWAGAARWANRSRSQPRQVLFLGGDLHAGGLFDITSRDFSVPCLFASGISRDSPDFSLGVTVDEEFEVGAGFRARLRTLVTEYNFGVIQVVPAGGSTAVVPSLVHSGTAWTWGVDAGLHEFPFGRPPGLPGVPGVPGLPF